MFPLRSIVISGTHLQVGVLQWFRFHSIRSMNSLLVLITIACPWETGCDALFLSDNPQKVQRRDF